MDLGSLLSQISIGQVGWGSVVVLVVILLVRGDIVSRKVHEAALALRDQAIEELKEERNYLRTARETDQQTIQEFGKQIDPLKAAIDVNNHLLRSVQGIPRMEV